MAKKRIKIEHQCWACDGKGKVFDTPRHKNVPCVECGATGIEKDFQHLYEDNEEVKDG